MVSALETGRGSVLHAHLSHADGYRVDAPEGYVGHVQGVPRAGRPPRPLVLVVSDGETVRFISLAQVAAVLPREQRIVLRPRQPTREPVRLTAAVKTLREGATARKWGRRPMALALPSLDAQGE